MSSGGGRCYFDRASAPEQLDKDEADAMAEALADAEALKERAQWHGSKRHLPVTTNGNAGRSYFDRASAPEQLEKDEADAIADALADAEALKERAQWHCHPSSPLVVDSMCKARNYFDGKDTSEVSSRRVRGESKMDQFDFEVEGIDIDTANDQALMKSALVKSALGAVRHQEDDSAATGTPEKEGNLSRSPSSVMLFDSPVA